MSEYDRFVKIIATKDYTKENKRFMFDFIWECDRSIVLEELRMYAYIDNYNRICLEAI